MSYVAKLLTNIEVVSTEVFLFLIGIKIELIIETLKKKTCKMVKISEKYSKFYDLLFFY